MNILKKILDNVKDILYDVAEHTERKSRNYKLRIDLERDPTLRVVRYDPKAVVEVLGYTYLPPVQASQPSL